MANANPTSERVYRAIKAELLAAGFMPGERIEAVQLAQRHMTSITPVRAALHRLAGEGLVDARAGEGFHTPQVTEASLRDLYAWNSQIVQLAWQLSSHIEHPSNVAAPLEDRASPADDNPTAIANVFATIGERSGNEQCAAAIDNLNDQLNLARRVEGELIKDWDEEFGDLVDTIRRAQLAEIRHTITAYHRRRIRLVSDLVRLMHRRSR